MLSTSQLFSRCAKYNLPATSLPDYETIFVQTQEFVNQCSAEQITCASDSCKCRSRPNTVRVQVFLKSICFEIHTYLIETINLDASQLFIHFQFLICAINLRNL